MANNTSTPVVIGIYGISGCGKTNLFKALDSQLGEAMFTFSDGSNGVHKQVPKRRSFGSLP